MCYGSSTSRSQKGDRERNVLIHDMDSGTFDVSLLTIFEMSNTQLGGEDFKNRTAGLFTQDFKPKHHVKELTDNHRDVRCLVTQCERPKRTLSSPTQATVVIDPFVDDSDFTLSLSTLFDDNALALSMSKARFEELNVDHSQKFTVPSREAPP